MAEIREIQPDHEEGDPLVADEERGSQGRLNLEHIRHPILFQIEDTPWLFKHTLFFRTRLSCFFSIVYMSVIVFLALSFIKKRDPTMLLLIFPVDIGFNLLSVLICVIWPNHHGLLSDRKSRGVMILLESLNTFFKLMAGFQFYSTVNTGPKDWHAFIVLMCFLGLWLLNSAGKTFIRNYESLIDSNFYLVHGIFLVLLAYKLNSKGNYSWATTFIVETIVGYVSFIVFSLAFGIFACVFSCIVAYGLYHFTFVSIMVFIGFRSFEGIVLIGLVQIQDPNSGKWVGNIQILLIIYLCFYLLVQLLLIFGINFEI